MIFFFNATLDCDVDEEDEDVIDLDAEIKLSHEEKY